jgi:hypothetical protein
MSPAVNVFVLYSSNGEAINCCARQLLAFMYRDHMTEAMSVMNYGYVWSLKSSVASALKRFPVIYLEILR